MVDDQPSWKPRITDRSGEAWTVVPIFLRKCACCVTVGECEATFVCMTCQQEIIVQKKVRYFCLSPQMAPRTETPVSSISNSLENALHTSAHSTEESLPKRPLGKHGKGG